MGFGVILLAETTGKRERKINARHWYASNQQENQGFKFHMKTLCRSLMPLSHIRELKQGRGWGCSRVPFPSQERQDSKNESNLQVKYLLFLNVAI